MIIITIGLNLAGILGDAEADTEGLLGRGVECIVEWIWGETRHFPRKKLNVLLEMACFVKF